MPFEQQRPAFDSPAGGDDPRSWRDESDVPLETATTDWQERHDTVGE